MRIEDDDEIDWDIELSRADFPIPWRRRHRAFRARLAGYWLALTIYGMRKAQLGRLRWHRLSRRERAWLRLLRLNRGRMQKGPGEPGPLRGF